MSQQPLMSFKSHVDGKNAEVAIYHDRVEWSQAGKVGLGKAALGAATMGASLAATGIRKGGSSEVLPVRAITSVTASKDGMRYHKVTIIVTGNTIEFRCDKAEAEQAKSLLTQLMLGSHPAQQTAAPAPAPTYAPPPPAPAAATPDVAEQLAKIGALRDQGLLSDEEFAAAKARIISG